MSHSKKAARLTATTLVAGLVLAAPALAARTTPAASDRPAAASSWRAWLGPVVELSRGPYIDPNGSR